MIINKNPSGSQEVMFPQKYENYCLNKQYKLGKQTSTILKAAAQKTKAECGVVLVKLLQISVT